MCVKVVPNVTFMKIQIQSLNVKEDNNDTDNQDKRDRGQRWIGSKVQSAKAWKPNATLIKIHT